MAEPFGELTRTHSCGALTEQDVGRDVVLFGWVHRIRDLGGVVFIDVRDRDGVTQIVVREGDAAMAVAKKLRPEYVMAASGRVEQRSSDTVNPKIATGAVEVRADRLVLLNEARTPPFPIADETEIGEELRLRYRYLDLRRPRLQRNMTLRHRVTLAIRNQMDRAGFREIETPILTKSTPEGARDYLVPSRVHPGKFFALPQSPQIFKQILMIAGVDRYFQIVRCFRDEDLRADRQPEFTQVDIEMSFGGVEQVFGVVEPLIQCVFREIGREPAAPFQRISYADAVARYGSDKPDLRFGMSIEDLSDLFRESPFAIARDALAAGGAVRGFVVPQAGSAPRRELDDLVEQAKRLGAGGLIWARRGADGALQTSTKAAGMDVLERAMAQAGAGPGDLLLAAVGEPEATSRLLGQLRLSEAQKRDLVPPDAFSFAWVVDFPMFFWNTEEGRYESMHHPFTAPHDLDVLMLESDPAAVRAKAYDLVLNGAEIGGGSIRIHDAAVQRRVFELLAIGEAEARERFGFFLDALEYGAPPHGGIALGLDRIVMSLAGENSIREVIAFPKTAAAVDLMAGAPSSVNPRQLRELRLRSDA
jgi:aspartyl-tRNA synthetase